MRCVFVSRAAAAALGLALLGCVPAGAVAPATRGGVLLAPQLAGSRLLLAETTAGRETVEGPDFRVPKVVRVQEVATDGTRQTLAERRQVSYLGGEVQVDQSASFRASGGRLALLERTQSDDAADAASEVALSVGALGSMPAPAFACTVKEAGRPATFPAAYALSDDSLAFSVPAGCPVDPAVLPPVIVVQRGDGTTGAVATVGEPKQLELAGDLVAFDRPDGVAVVNDRTNAELLSAPVTRAADFGVRSDGTLAVCASGRLDLLTPAEPAGHRVATPLGCSEVEVTPNSLVYRGTDDSLHRVDAAGADTQLLGPTPGLLGFDAEDGEVALARATCDGSAVYRLPTAVPSTLDPEPTSCPVRLPGGRLRLRGRKVVVPLRCPRGCVGSLRVEANGDGSQSGAATPVVVAGGRASVSVNAAEAFVGRHPRPRQVKAFLRFIPALGVGPLHPATRKVTVVR